jgi:hypothetical protein
VDVGRIFLDFLVLATQFDTASDGSDLSRDGIEETRFAR